VLRHSLFHRDELARRKFEWERTFGENFQNLQAEYDNAKIIWDSKLKNMERSGKQELLLAQRNSAAEKKKLESSIVHLESRIAMLEDVINNPDQTEVADSHDETELDLNEPARARATVAVDDELPDPSADDGSPTLSPSNAGDAKLILQLQEENQKLAESKRTAQLKYGQNIFLSSTSVLQRPKFDFRARVHVDSHF
jgi:hypothetical protein